MIKSVLSLAGVFPPIPTLFDEQGDVHYGALAGNLARLNEYDLAGYVVLGSNGEAVFLTGEEKLRVLETCRQAIPPGKLLLAGTGHESTRQTIAFTRRAAEVGADAALVVTPNYYTGKMTSDALVHHYHAVADASPIPVIMYNVPVNTGVDMSAATIARAAEHPNVVGIKDSGGNITKLGDVVRLTGPDFQVPRPKAGILSLFLYSKVFIGLKSFGLILHRSKESKLKDTGIHREIQGKK